MSKHRILKLRKHRELTEDEKIMQEKISDMPDTIEGEWVCQFNEPPIDVIK